MVNKRYKCVSKNSITISQSRYYCITFREIPCILQSRHNEFIDAIKISLILARERCTKHFSNLLLFRVHAVFLLFG